MLKPWETKAMVTGGAGFIGSHIVDFLLKMKMDVVSIDDYSTGKRENLAHLKGCEHFQEIDCDITDYDELKKHMEGIDIIFHNAAAKKNVCFNDPLRDLEVNAKGAYNVLQLAREFRVNKIVHASTGSVYGECNSSPQTEDHPLDPVSYYGISKLAGERYAMAFAKLYDMDITVLRYFHIYGPRQDCGEYGGVISIFTNKILKGEPITIFGDGTQERSFTYVGDVVRANIFVASSPKTRGQIYNCASGVTIKLKDAVWRLEKITGKKVKCEYADWVKGDIKHFDVDNSKLGDLGFKFKTRFLAGLKNTVDYFCKQCLPSGRTRETSKVFDNTTGIAFYGKRTICDMHRDIYDYLVVGLRDQPELLEKVIPILEEAMEVGVKMTLKLIDYKCSLPEWEDTVLTPEKVRLRLLRVRLTKSLKNNGRRLFFSSVSDENGIPDRSWFMEKSWIPKLLKEEK